MPRDLDRANEQLLRRMMQQEPPAIRAPLPEGLRDVVAYEAGVDVESGAFARMTVQGDGGALLRVTLAEPDERWVGRRLPMRVQLQERNGVPQVRLARTSRWERAEVRAEPGTNAFGLAREMDRNFPDGEPVPRQQMRFRAGPVDAPDSLDFTITRVQQNMDEAVVSGLLDDGRRLTIRMDGGEVGLQGVRSVRARLSGMHSHGANLRLTVPARSPVPMAVREVEVTTRRPGVMSETIVHAVDLAEEGTDRTVEMPHEPSEVEVAGPSPVEQTDLLPDEGLTGELRMVPLDRIGRHHEEPSDDFVENVRRLGLLQPVALIEPPNGRSNFMIAEGRRRVGALRRLGRTEIPAYVFPPGTTVTQAAAMTLSANVQRRANPVREFNAINSMVHRGMSEQQIAGALRIPLQTVRARMRLGNLSRHLRELFEQGALAPSVAERAARLDATRQEMLMNRYRASGRVTSTDVREVTQARDREAVEEMPDNLFATPDAPEVQVETITLAGSASAHPDVEMQGEIELQIEGFDEGWMYVIAALRLAEQAIPPSPNNETDEFMALLDDLRAAAVRAAGVQ